MAFVTKTGKSFAVKQGNTGVTLSRFSTRAAAKAEVRSLHRTNDPKSSNRGKSARVKNQ